MRFFIFWIAVICGLTVTAAPNVPGRKYQLNIGPKKIDGKNFDLRGLTPDEKAELGKTYKDLYNQVVSHHTHAKATDNRNDSIQILTYSCNLRSTKSCQNSPILDGFPITLRIRRHVASKNVPRLQSMKCGAGQILTRRPYIREYCQSSASCKRN